MQKNACSKMFLELFSDPKLYNTLSIFLKKFKLLYPTVRTPIGAIFMSLLYVPTANNGHADNNISDVTYIAKLYEFTVFVT
jgi:hypothetical protein